MLVDSHCHLNYAELSAKLDFYLKEMSINKIAYALCVATNPNNFMPILKIAKENSNIFASIGVHPDEDKDIVVTAADLLQYASAHKVIAIGETGLDYYHTLPNEAKYQQTRFLTHIDAAKKADLPLIIHTRNSFADTLAIMHENNAAAVGAVMHCFTENIEEAKKCLDLGFYISISGVVTFKNAVTVQDMAKYVPLDMLLVETDAPFLAPTPFRGKTNHPALVWHTAKFLAELKGVSLETLAAHTTANFFKLFKKATRILNS
jgi:TatD DNase family protein